MKVYILVCKAWDEENYYNVGVFMSAEATFKAMKAHEEDSDGNYSIEEHSVEE